MVKVRSPIGLAKRMFWRPGINHQLIFFHQPLGSRGVCYRQPILAHIQDVGRWFGRAWVGSSAAISIPC